jgi:hypothetical protein
MDFIYPVLFAILPSLLLCEKNIQESDVKEVYIITLKVFLFSILATMGIYFLVKDPHKTSFIILILTIMFYNSGLWFIILFSKFQRSQLKIKLFFSGILFLGSFLILVLVKIIPLEFKLITTILNPVAIFATFVVLVEFIKKYFKKVPEIKGNIDVKNLSETSNKDLPDIYHIILDAYSGNRLLKKELNFDNSQFVNFLESKGFKVLKEAKSNYRLTLLSIPSVLNFSYLDSYSREDAKNQKFPEHRVNLFQNNLWQFLLTHNYKIVSIIREMYLPFAKKALNISESSIKSKVPAKLEKNVEFIKCFNEKMYFSRVLFKNSFFGIWLTRKIRHKVAENTLRAFKQLVQITELKDSPKYVLTYVPSPHTPFVFGKNGEILKDPPLKTYLEQYKDQINGLNKHLEDLLTVMMQNMKKNSIIILHADHEINKQEFDIFNAVYLPDQANILPDNLSLVNLFRYILNHYFNANLEILEDEYF